MKTRLVFILIIFVFISNAIASNIDTVPIEKKQSEKIEQLKCENSDLKEQKSEVINVLKWSIGSIIIIIIALIGSNVYFNFRLSSKEIENIKKGIELDIKNIRIEIEKSISEKLNELNENFQKNNDKLKNDFSILEKEINTNIKNDNSKLSDKFQNQLDEFNNNYRQQISTIEKSFSSQLMALQENLEKAKENLDEKINTNTKKLNSTENALTKSIEISNKSIRASIERNAGYMWETRGVLSNSLTSYIRECEIYIELGGIDDMIELSLSNIIGIVKKMNIISNYDKYDLENLFKKLPSKFNQTKTDIKDLIDKKA